MRGAIILNPRTGRPEGERAELKAELIEHLQRRGAYKVVEDMKLAEEFPHIKASFGRNRHYIGARMGASSGATARSVFANLWNPSASARTFCYEAWICDTAATAGSMAITRSTARGTASTTVTPTLDNALERDIASPAGVVLDMAWSVAPTVSGQDLGRWNYAAVAGAGSMMPFAEELAIPPGTGIALITPVAVLFPISDVTFLFGD